MIFFLFLVTALSVKVDRDSNITWFAIQGSNRRSHALPKNRGHSLPAGLQRACTPTPVFLVPPFLLLSFLFIYYY